MSRSHLRSNLIDWALRFFVAAFSCTKGRTSLVPAGSLAIADIGQYAVVAFSMKRRTRDFGARMALGASSRQILSSVTAEGLRLTAVGLVIGFALSLAAGKGLGGFLYGITPTDGQNIDPLQALRQE